MYFTQHKISTGIGSCVSTGTSTNSDTYYCGTDKNCNNWNGFKCWNPLTGVQSSDTCGSSDWQCTVLNL